MTDQTKPSDFSKGKNADYSHIKGWGIDANPNNDPTYPIKNRTDEEQFGYTWQRPPVQPETVEILKSVERPNLTAVFGTAAPPSGLSGIIRRMAYKYSESDYRRWMPLILADRINMVEGLFDDLKKGYMPNVLAEKGIRAELKHNKKQLYVKIGAGVALTAAVAALAVYHHKRKKYLR